MYFSCNAFIASNTLIVNPQNLTKSAYIRLPRTTFKAITTATMPLVNHRMRSPAWVIAPALGAVTCAALLLGAGPLVLDGAYTRQFRISSTLHSLYSTHLCLQSVSDSSSSRVCMGNTLLVDFSAKFLEAGLSGFGSNINTYSCITWAYTAFVLISVISQSLTAILLVPLRIQYMRKQNSQILRWLFAGVYLVAFLAANAQVVLTGLLLTHKLTIPDIVESSVSPSFIILNVLVVSLCYIQAYPAILYIVVDYSYPCRDLDAASCDTEANIFTTVTRFSSATTIAYPTEFEKSKQVFTYTESVSSGSSISSTETPLPPPRNFAPSIATDSAPTLTSSSTIPSTI